MSALRVSGASQGVFYQQLFMIGFISLSNLPLRTSPVSPRVHQSELSPLTGLTESAFLRRAARLPYTVSNNIYCQARVNLGSCE